MTIHLGLPDLQLIGLDIKCTSASLSRHGVLYFSFVFLHCSVWSVICTNWFPLVLFLFLVQVQSIRL